MILRWLTRLAAGGLCSLLWSATCKAGEAATLVLAQAIGQPAGGAGGAGGVKIGATGGKNYIVETFVVIVLFGLALFTVCKSSRRV